MIREEIGRNQKTLNTDPIQYYDTLGPGVEVNLYPSDTGYSAQVEVEDYPELSTPVRVFSNEEEAKQWTRSYVEWLRGRVPDS